MRRALLVAVVAGVALLGGCNAIASDATGDEPETLTPVPLGEPDGQATDAGDLPPGVSPSGSVDPQRVEDAHLAYLANRSFTLVRFRSSDDPDGDDGQRSLFLAGPGGEHRIRSVESDVSMQIYANRTGEYIRTRNERTGRVNLSTSSIGNYTLVRRGEARSVAKYVDETADDVDEVRRNGSVLYRLEFGGDDDVPRSLDGEIAVSGTYSATVYLTPDGLIRAVVVRIRPVDGAPTETTRFQFTNVGDTTVERPGWVENATGAAANDDV